MEVPDALAAWVAEEDGEIVGHVALRSDSSPTVVAMASGALKLPPDRLGVVAGCWYLLFTDDTGSGDLCLRSPAGTLTPGTVADPRCGDPTGQGDLLYNKCGWTRAGQVTSRYGDDVVLDEFVYIGPRPPLD